MTYVNKFASLGLRTLLLAERNIQDEEYQIWSRQFDKAQMLLEGKEEELDRLYNEIERDFDLIGSTAIEDKLQEGVQDTIHSLKKAGIQIWVLTGDKVETAINIGYSAGLLSNDIY